MAYPSHEVAETALDSSVAELELIRTIPESDRRLAEVYRHILSEQELDTLLERIAETLAELVPYDALHIYEADESRRVLVPVFARSDWSEEIMRMTSRFGEGITGWAVENREPVLTNQAQLDSRVKIVPGTPAEPEALITVPLVARGALKGALNIYRLGEDARFVEQELELAKWFADAAALALDNAQVHARLEHLAQTDSLTGLFNHRYFHERLRGELNRASRGGDATALLVFDIDDFKRVNDVHGHAVGDQVLTVLARVGQDVVRCSDVLCRIGGEEFAVIMPSCGIDGAAQLAWRLAERVAATEIEAVGRVSVSVGIAAAPSHAVNPRELLACADVAMMTAKAGGKRTVVVFDGDVAARPGLADAGLADAGGRDRNSIAHLKMLQSLAGRLNRLSSVAEIGEAIAAELGQLIEFDQCRVLVSDGTDLVPVAAVDEVELPFGQIARTSRIGEGIVGRAAQTGEPLLVRDALHSPFAVHAAGARPVEESLIVVPLRAGAQYATGAIALSKQGVGRFDEDDLRLLEVLAGHAAAPLENARLYEAERSAGELARSVLALGRELASVERLEDLLALLAQRSAAVLGSRAAAVWLQDEVGGDLRARAWWGYEEDEAALLARAVHPPELPLVATRAAERLASGPMRFADGTVGVLAVSVEPDLAYGDRLLRGLADVAAQAQIAIDAVRKVEGLQRMYVSTIEVVADAIEASGGSCPVHASWVAEHALRVGRALGLGERAMQRLELAALLHDIGKLGIPVAILLKGGELSAEERLVVEQHAVVGDRILARIEELADVRPIVRACHERWDGCGYPDRLAAEEIPLEARIILTCDAYHAMTTDRPYRRRLSEEEAARRLRESAGSQLDPSVVDAFLRLI